MLREPGAWGTSAERGKAAEKFLLGQGLSRAELAHTPRAALLLLGGHIRCQGHSGDIGAFPTEGRQGFTRALGGWDTVTDPPHICNCCIMRSEELCSPRDKKKGKQTNSSVS